MQRLNRTTGDYHAALAHSHDPGVPRLSAQRRRVVPAQRSRAGRYRPRSLGYPACCGRPLQRLKSLQPTGPTDSARLVRALSYLRSGNLDLGDFTSRRKALPVAPMTGPQSKTVHIVGAGLAGSEAAWQVARAGVPVVLHEMRPDRMTEAHRTDGLAELVCSNSFRSDDAANNAVGLLHAEMRRLGSLIMRAADANQVPAGGALAVDRDGFSAAVTRALADHPLIEIARGEIAGLPSAEWDNVIIATGPLTSAPLADAIRALTDENALAFFDAIAPIVHKDSIDMSVAWFQ